MKSNIQIAMDILSYNLKMDPAVVYLNLRLTKETQILFLSNLISMTPGSLTLSYDSEQNILKVHVMHNSKNDNFEEDLDRLQNRILKITN
jgi:multicomponent Na+:H+ antiporter subunit E